MEDRAAAQPILHAGPPAEVPARLHTHLDPAATPCDECSADTPAATTSTLNRWHLPSCSLHPANGTPARRWNHHVTDRGGWCPWSLVSVSPRLDDAQPCPAGCGNSHIVEERGPGRMTPAEAAANQAAELLAMATADERPAMRLPVPDRTGFVMLFGYWRDGALVVTVDTEECLSTVHYQLRVNDAAVAAGSDR